MSNIDIRKWDDDNFNGGFRKKKKHENPKNNEKVIKNLKNNQNIVKKRGINGKKFIFISMLNISCDNQMVMDND